MWSIGRPKNLSSYQRKIETSNKSGFNFVQLNKTPTPALKKFFTVKDKNNLGRDEIQRSSSFGRDEQWKFDTPERPVMKNIYEK
jgi:hypothetical protein